MNAFHIFIKRQHGVAAVEFSLLLILLLMIVAGVIEFGRTFWYYDALTKATRDSARFLSNSRAVNSPPAIDNTLKERAIAMVVQSAVAANVPNFSETNVDDVDCDPDCNAPTYVTVRINAYTVKIGDWIPLLTPTVATSWEATLSPSTTMRYMCPSTGSC